MRCRDRYKDIYLTVKCISKKFMNPYLNQAIIDEINLLKLTQCKLFPTLCKIFEDENQIFITFVYFHGLSLSNIFQKAEISEIYIGTIIFKILKGLKQLHKENYYHGSICFENIIFCSERKDNLFILINHEYSSQHN